MLINGLNKQKSKKENCDASGIILERKLPRLCLTRGVSALV